jgi:hypothetical protein
VLYADLPARRVRQVLADLIGLAWCTAVVLAARAVHDTVALLAVPGRELEDTGSSIAGSLDDAAAALADLPLVGDEVSAPVADAAGAARGLAEAGRAQQAYVADVAVAAGLALAGAGLLLAAALWVLPRVRWMRRAAAVRAALADPDALDLLALRALVTAPVPAVARLGDGLLDGWRRGDRQVVGRLAAYELARIGLRAPAS